MQAKLRASAADAWAGALARPLHVGLASFVMGLFASPWGLRLVLATVGVVVVVAMAAFARRAARSDTDGGGHERRIATDRAMRLLASAALLAALGAAAGAERVQGLEASRLGPLLGRQVTEHAVVQQAARPSRFGGWSTLVEVRGEPVLLRVVERGAGPPGASGRRLPEPGEVLEVSGRLRAASPFARGRGAHAELHAAAATAVGRRGGVLGVLDGVRRAAERALDRGLPPSASGLLRGMVLGQDAALPETTRDAFRASGLSHLVAASGTNVVLLAALATGLATALGLGLSGRLWLVLALIALYVPLAGGGPSIQRAGVMGAAAVAAGLAGRPSSRWWALGLAAAVTLAIDPRAAKDPGWQLSFVAVLAILVAAGPLREALGRRGVPVALAEVIAMTAAATWATAPVVAAHFGQASLVGLPVNVLAAPAVAPIMWLGIAAAALGQLAAVGGLIAALVGAAADGLVALAGFPLGYLTWLARLGEALPGGVVHVGPWVVLLVCAGLSLAFASRQVRRASPLAAVLCAGLLVGLEPARAAPPGAPEGLRVTLLDVGQGDATLLQIGSRAVLVDTGAAEVDVVALLKHAGVARLDALVVTHAQADHLGAAAAVVSAFRIGLILDGRDGVPSAGGDAMGMVARRRQVPLVAPHTGQVLRLGSLRLRVLWPRDKPPGAPTGVDPNQRAIVLEAETPGARALLTSDAESDILARLELRPVDLLKVSHHGSDDPGLPALLARLRPRVAAIEVGAHNTYGHPAPSTLAALAGVPVVVRTDRDGTVRLDHDDTGGWEVRAHV